MQSAQERDVSARAAFVVIDPVNAPARLYRDPVTQCAAHAREVVLFSAFEAAQALA